MAVHSIAKVVNLLQELLIGLNQAYWESTSVDRKDFFYDIISAVHLELSELNKLSIQDHDMEWQPITTEFGVARSKLSKLRKLLDEYVLRSTTLAHLESLLDSTAALHLR